MQIKELKDNLCAGCGMCESVFGEEKIKMSFSESGFLRPNFKQKLSKEESEEFKELCPGINAKHESKENYDPLWGPYLSISSGFSSNCKIRHAGSSGGALTGIATYLLEKKIVECILHIGASVTLPSRNEHKVSYTSDELLNNAGSRYAPSATLVNIVEILKNHTSIAVIGKPCDIVGVRNLMKMNDEAKSKIKYLLSFMCAGVPSQLGTTKIIEKFNITEQNVASLRYRGEGWPGYFKIKDDKNNIHKMTYNESWGTVLNKHLQFRCKICADGTGEFADITCADAWEASENGYPSFEEKKGVSLIISRNENGKKLLKEAVASGYITMSGKKYSSSEIAQMQPYQKQRKQNLLARLIALKLFGKKIPNYNTGLLVKASLKENPLRLLKNFVGMIKRLL
jgi:coenzyme F420 hydrogenase subunit beta